MHISRSKQSSTARTLSTHAGTSRSHHFLSLKWKVAIPLTVMLLAANAGLAYLGYINFERQFDYQLQHAVTRSTNVFNSLLQQARNNLQNLGESLIFDAGEDDGSIEKLSTRLKNNWVVMQLNWGLESATIFNTKGQPLTVFGDESAQTSDNTFLQTVTERGEPATAIRCDQHCLLVAAIPILLKNGDLYILIIKSSIADLIIDFSRGNADGSVLLSQGPGMTEPGPWGYQIAAATHRERDQNLLQQAATKFERSQILNEGVWFDADDQHAYHLHAIPIDSRNEQRSKTLLVLIDDISTQRRDINKHIGQHVVAAIIGMLASEALLLFILWGPMQRIKKQADILPRLAHGDFLQTPSTKSTSMSRMTTHDELDVLDDATFDLSQRLNNLSRENQQRAQTLEYMALYDHLTGLANRRLFLDHLTQAVLEYERNEEKFSVLFFDLDNFKRVNDSFGHDVGDELLKQVARRLRENTRATDTVARLSGDEFTVLLKHIDDGALLHLVEKIRLALQIPVTVGATQILVTPSIGIVVAPDNGLEADQLLRNADVAMYEAKRAGGNSYYFFTEEINYKAAQLLRIESELREALDNRQFFLVYQPLVDLFSMQIIGMEALVRWQHPKEGIVPPDKFIGIMENNGMIIELGAQVIAQACRDLGQLEGCGSAFTVSVNLSPRQLHDHALVETLEWQLRSNQVDPRRLKIEITENSLIEDVEENIEILNQLKDMGLTLSIDDFGTGYSSLSYLKMLPVDELKVDRRFINDITDDIDDREITAAVIAMAHKLQLKVVAEGIENAEQLDFLRRNHCDTGQGYLFSKPIVLPEIKKMLLEGIPAVCYGI